MYMSDFERLAELVHQRCRLFMSFANRNGASQAAFALQGLGLKLQFEGEANCTVDIPESRLESVCSQLAATVESGHLNAARVVVLRAAEAMSVDHVTKTCSLAELIQRIAARPLLALLKTPQLPVHFQPIFDGVTGDVVGWESLLRCTTASGDAWHPKDMLRDARAAGLSHRLESASRKSAIEMASQQGLRGSRLFMNVSAAAFFDPHDDLVQTIVQLGQYGLAPANIVLEISDADRIEDVSNFVRALEPYRTLGFKIALDNTSSVFAGGELRKMLRSDYLKIDLQCVRNADADVIKREMMRRMTSSVHEMGGKVIAAGVETVGEITAAQDCGVDFLQGFRLAQPLPILRYEGSMILASHQSAAAMPNKLLKMSA